MSRHEISLNEDEVKSEDNYVVVSTNKFESFPELKDTVRIVVEDFYEVFATVARINNKRTQVILFLDTWSYAMLYSDDD